VLHAPVRDVQPAPYVPSTPSKLPAVSACVLRSSTTTLGFTESSADSPSLLLHPSTGTAAIKASAASAATLGSVVNMTLAL